MNWKDAMHQSATNAIKHENGSIINGPGPSFRDYDLYLSVNDSHIPIWGIPGKKGVQRTLEEFDIPDHGWK